MCLLLFKEDLYYGTKEEQSQLLQKVLAANDTEAEEERMVGEMLGAKGQVRNKTIVFNPFVLGDFLDPCL